MANRWNKDQVNLDALNRRYFDVDLTVRNLVMHRLGKLLRNFRMKLREKYILPNLNTPSKLNELPAKYSAIVKAEEWVEFVNYTTTDAYKEKSARGKMVRSKNVYHHKMGRGGYVFVKEKMIENKEIEADEEPPRGIMWLKGRVNKDGEFIDDEIRSVGDKLKESDDKIKEGTLNLDDGTDAMTVVFGKKKRGYARGVESGVTYKRNLLKLSDLRKCLSHEETGLKIPNRKEMCLQHRTELTAIYVQTWHLKKSNIYCLGTDISSAWKQMLHNQALPNDCYKVSIDSSLVDAACILDVGNNGLKTVKDGVGGFFAWPKNQVVLDEECIKVFTLYSREDLEDVSEDFQIEFESLPFVYFEFVESVMYVNKIPELMHVDFWNICSDEKCRIESSVAFFNVKYFLLWNKFQIKFGLLSSNGRHDSAKISEDSLIFLGFQASDGLRRWMHRLLYINCQAVDGLCGNISLLGRIERVIWDGGEESRN
ncbi:putative transposase, Ptta/En/Spm, plant [Tanacetum coccineum]